MDFYGHWELGKIFISFLGLIFIDYYILGYRHGATTSNGNRQPSYSQAGMGTPG
jgi:hypothetical protein